MIRLSKENLEEVSELPKSPIIEQRKTWLDLLPSGCQLPELFRTGKSLSDCLEIVSLTEEKQSKLCRKKCRIDCKKCHQIWTKAAEAMVLSKQVDRAFAGDPSMLQWYGKAVLKQQEIAIQEEQIVPSIINISGLNVDQEAEINSLRLQLADYQRKLSALPAAEVTDDG